MMLTLADLAVARPPRPEAETEYFIEPKYPEDHEETRAVRALLDKFANKSASSPSSAIQ
jgi:hypothetical protein